MGDLARLRELKALMAQGANPEPADVDNAWQADPSNMPWHTEAGEDPRPDLPGSDLWARLLLLAAGDANDAHGVYGRVLGARACGAILERRAGRWKLAPTLDPTERLSVWADGAAWQADCERWLRPRAREIVALLAQLPPRSSR